MSQRVTTKHDIQKDEINSALVPAFVIGGRLTLASATPVMTSNIHSGTSIYYTPYVGNLVLIYDGVSWSETNFSELTLSLDSNTGTTGFHQSGKNFDLFVYSDAGTLRLVSSPAWTSDTARSTALEYVNGILVNAASMTARYGSASGSVVTVPRDCGTYVGTFRASANGQTQFIFGAVAANGTAASFLLWNMYNRRNIVSMVGDNADSWNYASNPAVWRAANGSNTMRVDFVSGLAEDGFIGEYSGAASGLNGAAWGVGYDSTTAFSGTTGYGAASNAVFAAAKYETTAIGFHYLQAIEKNQQDGLTITFYGDAGLTHFQSGLHFTGWM